MPDAFVLVDGPAFVPLRYGLLSVAPPSPEPDPHWMQGVQWTPDVCDGALTLTTVCVTGVGPTGTPVTGSPALAAQPFRVYAKIRCSPVGEGNDLAILRARAEAALTNGEARAVERVFWAGAAGNGTIYPHLAANAVVSANAQGAQTVQVQSAATTVGGGTLDMVEAFGTLEGSLGNCYGGEGVIHVPRSALAQISNKNLATVQGGQLRTLGGNLVAAYAPSLRTAPDGTTPATGTAYLYATGAVKLWRGPIKHVGITPGEVVDRRTNTAIYQAYRYYAIGWDCCHFAAAVSLGGDITGTVGAAT